MMGKRISSNSGNNKTRIATKGHEGGKPSSPGLSTYSKPVKTPPSQPKFREYPNIPYISVQENTTVLPRYTAISTRPIEETIGMDELDTLQNELENLLCTVALRRRMLQNEIENIDVSESKREKKGKAAGKQLQYPIKRKYPDEKSKEHVKQSTPQAKIPKFKNFTPVIAPVTTSQGSFSHDNILTTDSTVKLDMPSFAALQPKNNMPYKFWTSIDSYCGPITNDDYKFLESLLATSSNMSPPPIPPLGKHYTELWSDESTTDEQASSAVQKHKNANISNEATHLRKKAEKSTDGMISGPLTQRLVSALMEDSQMQFDPSDPKLKHNNFPIKNSPSIRNSLTLEKILRKELVDQGLLDPEDLPPLTNPADDEILSEIKKCQTELNILRKENSRNLKNMLSLCKQEMSRTSIKKQLEQVDAECSEAHKKNLAAKLKKRPLTKKERDDAWKVVNEQIRLNNEINALPLSGPNTI